MKIMSGLLMAAALSSSVAFAADKTFVVDIVNVSESPITVNYRICPIENYMDVRQGNLQKCSQEQSFIVTGTKSGIKNGNVAHVNIIRNQEFVAMMRLQNSNGSSQNDDNTPIGYSNGLGYLLNDFGTSKIYIQDIQYAG
jgi:hypothetical protein